MLLASSKPNFILAILFCAVLLPGLELMTPVSAGSTQVAVKQTKRKKSCCTMVALVPRPVLSASDTEITGYVKRSFNYLGAADFMNVFIEANEALKSNPDNPLSHYLSGVALMSLLDFKEAAEQFSESLKLNPSSADAHFMLGQAYRLSFRFSEALSEYQEALTLKPNFAAAQALVGECYRMQGNYIKAKTKCNEAILLDPQLPLPHTILAENFLLQDNIEQCEAEYATALTMAADDPYVHFRYGQALCVMKRWTDAEAELRKALELDPKYADAALGLALALTGQEKTADALYYSKNAVALAPNDVDTHRLLAQLYSRNGQHDLAVREYKISRGLRPRNLYIQRALALELAQTQNLDEAIVEISLIMKQFPLDEELKLEFNALLQLKNKDRSGMSD